MKDLQLKFIVDPTTIRWFRILNLFERTQKATKGQLAKLNEVSERTILTDINKLKEYFSDSAQIVSTNNGYLFEKKNALRFIEQKEKLLQNEILFELLGNVFYGELEDVAELIDRFHISETSFRRYLRQIEPVLKEYGLKLSLTPIDLKGDEANIRKFFKDFYYEGEMTPHTLVPPKEIHELIYQTFLSKIKEITIGTGTSPNEFYYNLYIAIERVRQGKRINVPTNLYKSVRNNKDFLNLFLIQQRIQKIYQVELCADELCWLFLVTIAKRPFDQIDQDKVFCTQLQRIDSFAHLTENYLKNCSPELYTSEILWIYRAFFLSRYVNHLISPVQNRIMSEIIEKTKHECKESYINNHHFLRSFFAESGITEDFLEDITASLTLLGERLKEQYLYKSKRIVFLLEGDLYVCQLIRSRVYQYFGDRHQIFFITIPALTEEFLNQEDIDLIVTNYSEYLSEYKVSTNCLLLKTVPDKQDWELLFKTIEPKMFELIK
ncbi:helix-turn-helix domain-containing protein [Enterococcus casseliflavus]|jgi:hypothetical protein|uniref:helix-turn-helix domain-containing protein n=1 Tax=Enterococcus casseliflavus TaxID=37734 RepID=UPI0035E29A1C